MAFVDRFLPEDFADCLFRLFVAWFELLNPVPTGQGGVEVLAFAEGAPAKPVDGDVVRVEFQSCSKIDDLGVVQIHVLARLGHAQEGGGIPRIGLEYGQPALDDGLPVLAQLRLLDPTFGTDSAEEPLLFALVFLEKVRQAGLGIAHIARVGDHALREELVGVIVVAFRHEPIGSLKKLSEALASCRESGLGPSDESVIGGVARGLMPNKVPA